MFVPTLISLYTNPAWQPRSCIVELQRLAYAAVWPVGATLVLFAVSARVWLCQRTATLTILSGLTRVPIDFACSSPSPKPSARLHHRRRTCPACMSAWCVPGMHTQALGHAYDCLKPATQPCMEPALCVCSSMKCGTSEMSVCDCNPQASEGMVGMQGCHLLEYASIPSQGHLVWPCLA
jgi:hypothetical protein